MSRTLTLLFILTLAFGLTPAHAAAPAGISLIVGPRAITAEALPVQTLGALPLPGVDLATAVTGTRADAASAKTMTRAERREARKSFRASLKEMRKSLRASGSAAVSENKLLIIIVAILLAPVGMFLYEGEANKRVLITFLLWLLFFLPGIIYALYFILQGK